MARVARASAASDKLDAEKVEATTDFEAVFKSEIPAINLRRTAQRKQHRNFPARPPIPAGFNTGETGPVLDAVGLTLSGGGIRSAAFCLGALQALDATPIESRAKANPTARKKQTKKPPSVLDQIDYLSTVSGGGYIGCCLSAGLSNREGAFPFESLNRLGETRSVKHIRDHSNYLFPNGRLDVLDSIAIYLRGLMANAVIVASALLFLVVLTIACSPTWVSLSQPRFFNYVHHLVFPSSPPGPETGDFHFTKYFFFLMLLFFIVWALGGAIFERVKRWRPLEWLRQAGEWLRYCRNQLPRLWRSRSMRSLWTELQSAFNKKTTPAGRDFVETSSPIVRVAGYFLALVVIGAFCELQPVLIGWLFAESESVKGSGQFLQIATAVLGVFATIIGFFASKLETVAKSAAAIPGWRAFAKWIASRSAVWFASIALPLVLWFSYLILCYWGIKRGNEYAAQTWLSGFAQTNFRVPAEFSVSLAKYAEDTPAVSQIVDFLSNFPLLPSVMSCFLGVLNFTAIIATPIAALYLLLAVILFLVSLFPTPNANSLHRLYRDRLSRAFVFYDPVKTENDGMRWLRDLPSRLQQGLKKLLQPGSQQRPEKEAAVEAESTERDGLKFLDRYKLSALSERFAPYHIINAALNTQGSRYANQRGRNADFFVFSRNYVGSEATKYVPTTRMETIASDLTLATAMAVSGAAASANMGSSTVRPLVPTLAILNIRLAYWLRNPIAAVGSTLHWKRILAKLSEVANIYFFKELLSRLDEKTFNVYLTDGGHIENLGIYQLLKRRCRLIIAVDAESDPKMNFPSFVKLERHARIDLGVIIDLPWRRLKAVTLETGESITTTGGAAAADTRKGPHCVIGRIYYRNSKESPSYLVYIKASLSGDENDYIADYKRRHERFPHETTGDQFFTEEQFEVYRALGFHAARSFLKDDEETPTFADRIADPGPTPPMYARPLSEKGREAIDEIRAILRLAPLPPASKPKRKRAAVGR